MREGWSTATVDEVCDAVSVGIVIKPAQYYVDANHGVRAFRSANVGENKVVDRDWIYLSEEGHRANIKSALRAGDVLVVRSGAPGTACVVPPAYEGSNCIDIVFARPKPDRVCSDYLAFLTNSDVGRRHILGHQGGLALKHFNVGAFKKLELRLPPLPKQRKIAAILRTWDEAIEKLSDLRKAKEARLSALRTSLLFNGFRTGTARECWPMRRLGEVTQELVQRNAEQQFDRSTVMGVSNARGIVPMREQTVAANTSRYLLLPPLGFAYNPMRINVGSIAMNKSSETFLVSPDYVVFVCREGGLEPDYLDHLRKTRWWLHHINAGASGSVRQRTYFDDLAALQLHLPKIEEQRAIVSVLNAAKTDVDLTDREIAALTRQKRGLMQKLLTGEWAVNIEGVAA